MSVAQIVAQSRTGNNELTIVKYQCSYFFSTEVTKRIELSVHMGGTKENRWSHNGKFPTNILRCIYSQQFFKL